MLLKHIQQWYRNSLARLLWRSAECLKKKKGYDHPTGATGHGWRGIWFCEALIRGSQWWGRELRRYVDWLVHIKTTNQPRVGRLDAEGGRTLVEKFVEYVGPIIYSRGLRTHYWRRVHGLLGRFLFTWFHISHYIMHPFWEKEERRQAFHQQ